MNVDPYLDTLARQLAEAAAVGGPDTVGLAERLAAPLRATARLVIQDALSDAMTELTLDLAPGTAEMRLQGRDLRFVVSGLSGAGAETDAAAYPSATASAPLSDTSPGQPFVGSDDVDPGDAPDSGTARITFRPPDRLKTEIEAAAERESLSVNAYLIRTLTSALRTTAAAQPTGPGHQGGQQSGPQVGNRLDGWVL